ncbi:MAG: efflux RND transporter periplasmic adaptor subunit [Gemmatimonadaceae bacterium]
MIRPRFAVLTLAAAIACGNSATPKAPPPTPVRVAPVTRIDAPLTFVATGVVQPMQTVSVTAQVTGMLMDVLFKEGDYVDKGQLLLRLDPRQLTAASDQARANLSRDDAQAAAAKKDDERYRTLAGQGWVSRSQADQFHATALAQAATVEADRAALRAAQVNLGFTSIRAPISGRTGSLLVRRGNNVSPTSGPIVVINQISPVLVRFPVLSQDFTNVQRSLASHPLVVNAVSNDSTETTEHGELRFLDNQVDSLTGTVMGKATFQNAARRLWPGELLFLTIRLETQRGVLAVPTAAVMTGQQGTYVYVVDAKNAAAMRPIAIAQEVDSFTVVPHGVALGERVVTDGQSRLRPGSRVSLIGADTTRTRTVGGSVDTTGAGAKPK